MKEEKKYWLDDPRNVDKIFRGLCWICAVTVLLGVVDYKSFHHPWEAWTGFFGVYGFVSCVGLVWLAKQLRKLVKRKEDYYDE